MFRVLNNRLSAQILIGSISDMLPQTLPCDRRIVVLTDSRVEPYCRAAMPQYEHIVVPSGERSKSLTLIEEVIGRLMSLGCDRDTLLVGFGGGVVTDITGFVASVFMRGVEFGFVPTTLLAMVDAAIGGKNGVDVGGFKNVAGCINEPRFVLCDTELLSTLSDEEFAVGIAEVIKSGIIGDEALFRMLEQTSLAQLRHTGSLLEQVIERTVRVKCDIVAQDANEKSVRRVLNLGHTAAHAIERIDPDFGHGRAVAVGLNYVAQWAAQRGKLSLCDAERIADMLDKFGFDTLLRISREELCEGIVGDKKCYGGVLKLVVPRAIGRCEVCEVAVDDFAK